MDHEYLHILSRFLSFIDEVPALVPGWVLVLVLVVLGLTFGLRLRLG